MCTYPNLGLEQYEVAFTGVAAANLGAGSKTIDSVFHADRADALEDLAGEQLDELVDELAPVKLLVIDEVSTCGAVAFEVINHRMQQAKWVLWRRRFHCEPPVDMGPFGGAGVLLIGDFAQLPPVLSTSLMAGMRIIESGGVSAQSMALAGRQTSMQPPPERGRRLQRLHGSAPRRS